MLTKEFINDLCLAQLGRFPRDITAVHHNFKMGEGYDDQGYYYKASNQDFYIGTLSITNLGTFGGGTLLVYLLDGTEFYFASDYTRQNTPTEGHLYAEYNKINNQKFDVIMFNALFQDEIVGDGIAINFTGYKVSM